MRRRGIKPNAYTVTSCISALARGGEWERAIQVILLSVAVVAVAVVVAAVLHNVDGLVFGSIGLGRVRLSWVWLRCAVLCLALSCLVVLFPLLKRVLLSGSCLDLS